MSFSRGQQKHYRPAVKRAWLENCRITGDAPNNKAAQKKWYQESLMEIIGTPTTAGCDQKNDFDDVMLHFAIIAGDEYWIGRIASSKERRIFWYLDRFRHDLEYLEKVKVDWEYIRGIYTQSGTLPERMSNCPAKLLQKVLAMLDTHIRRLCKDYGIRPCELPSRAHPQSSHPVKINTDNHHIHVGHDLDYTHAKTATEPF